MINAYHLLWIIPLSMLFGAISLIGISAILINNDSRKEEQRKAIRKEIRKDCGCYDEI
jgi:hypothetical protein